MPSKRTPTRARTAFSTTGTCPGATGAMDVWVELRQGPGYWLEDALWPEPRLAAPAMGANVTAPTARPSTSTSVVANRRTAPW